jgi:cold-inducible RNA-binding protein
LAREMNIYVGNLSLDTTPNDLLQEFVKFGEVLSVTIMDDQYIGSGQPTGYAYIEMARESEGEAAITNIEGMKIRDHVINAVKALPLSNKTNYLKPKSINKSYRRRERRYKIS